MVPTILRNQLYYSIKPFTPQALRLKIRRWYSKRKRRQTHGVWPIMPGSETAPAGWTSWPDGKQFGFVLTHDVEGTVGLKNCHRVMELERKLGFRSSFNFIPEGSYRVRSSLRRDLVADGFEVGIHDLNHDGRLYQSRRTFSRKAERINHYLMEWQAAGFRSGFMLNELSWLHELDIEYDASTFDTDPFEPQPEGRGTIFPFWVPPPTDIASVPPPSKPRAGYLELPYTLPQDSTIFLVLQEGPEVWLRKLDWIAEHGGMALVNVHPDYLCFDGKASSSTYPAAYYRQFLEYIRTRYANAYWHATPREVARLMSRKKAVVPDAARADKHDSAATFTSSDSAIPETRESERAAGVSITTSETKYVLAVLNKSFAEDPRPRRELEALVDSGYRVRVLCFMNEANAAYSRPGLEFKVFPMHRRKTSRARYLLEFFLYFFYVAGQVSSLAWKGQLAFVQIFVMPEFMTLSCLPAKILHKPVVVDWEDLGFEVYLSKYGASGTSLPLVGIRCFEWVAAWMADIAVFPNAEFISALKSRGVEARRSMVVMNSAEAEILTPGDGDESSSCLKIVFSGTILPYCGFTTLLRAMKMARAGGSEMVLSVLAREADFRQAMASSEWDDIRAFVACRGFLKPAEMIAEMRKAHVGVVTNDDSPFTRINVPTRIFEWGLLGKPLISSRLLAIGNYFGEDELIFFPPGDAHELGQRLALMIEDPEIGRAYARRLRAKCLTLTWSRFRRDYLEAIHQITGANKAPSIPGQAARHASFPPQESDASVILEEIAERTETHNAAS